MNAPHNTPDRIREVLKPLQQETTPAEYLHQLKAMVEWDRRLRTLEVLYAEINSRVDSVKKEIDLIK